MSTVDVLLVGGGGGGPGSYFDLAIFSFHVPTHRFIDCAKAVNGTTTKAVDSTIPASFYVYRTSLFSQNYVTPQ
jgi:hypothetical protein